MMSALEWQGMQNKILIMTITLAAISAMVSIAQSENIIDSDEASNDSSIQASTADDRSQSDEEIAKKISEYESIDAQLFGDSVGKNYLPTDI